MSDFFFQIILAIVSAVIGISVPFLPSDDQKKVAKLLAIILIAIALIWAGYELGRRQNINPEVMTNYSSTPAFSPTETLFPTQSIQIQPTITPSVSSLTSTMLCFPTEAEYAFLGSDWSSAPTFLPSIIGSSAIFTHCPPTTTIQYESIAVDDELQKVELVCVDGETDIKNLFTPFTITNEELIHYRSLRIELRQNCRIDFTVKDTKGIKIGMQIKLSTP